MRLIYSANVGLEPFPKSWLYCANCGWPIVPCPPLCGCENHVQHMTAARTGNPLDTRHGCGARISAVATLAPIYTRLLVSIDADQANPEQPANAAVVLLFARITKHPRYNVKPFRCSNCQQPSTTPLCAECVA